MKHPRLSKFLRAFGPQWASIAVCFFLLLLFRPGTAETGFVGGARLNNGELFGVIGSYKSLSERMALFFGGDLGADESAWSTEYMLTFRLSGKLKISALLGPQIEISETDPTDDQTITYLMASSGFILSYPVADNLSLWAGSKYLITEANLHKWKFGLGFVAFVP